MSPPVTSASPPAPRPSCWPPPPRIVAEALRSVHDPLGTILTAGPRAAPGAVAHAIAGALLPHTVAGLVPGWLRPEQRLVLPRVRGALARFGGALLADPVGSGKTWVALAAVAAGGDPAVAVVPAALRAQWRDAAARAGVALALTTHEAVSRGRLPEGNPRLVIVDESHRFRTPATRRYATLARWMVGRDVLLLSATPVVNRLDDLAHQLLLAVADDALAAHGVPSLTALLARGDGHAALGELVLCRARPGGLPASREQALSVSFTPAEGRLLAGLDALRLSRDPGVAALVRVLLLRALASSPAALAGALERYLALLAHARAARAGGRRVSRAALRQACGAALDQYTLWELLPDPAGGDTGAELHPGDHDRVARLLAHARHLAATGDARVAGLAGLLADRRPTLVFTGSRDTLGWLRERLAPLRPAWVTGRAAGIGHARLPRQSVLRWFGVAPPPLPPGLSAPTVLLATDVAAEGLDLQRATRVVHYDLPWTSVRLEQREGRARRLGQAAAEVEVVRFTPPPALALALAEGPRLERKRRLAGRVGLGDDAAWLHRWRAELAEWHAGEPGIAGHATVLGEPAGWLVGIAYHDTAAPGDPPHGGELCWFPATGAVVRDPAHTIPLLRHVATLAPVRPSFGPEPPWGAVRALVRERLQHAAAAGLGPPLGLEQRRVLRALRELALRAARRRDAALLARCDAALARLGAGLSAGATLLVADAARAGGDLLLHLAPLLATPAPPRAPRCLVPRITGLVQVASFPACHRTAPSSLISTGR